MDVSAVKAIVDAHVQRLVDALWLQEWHITIEYRATEEEHWAASCARQNDYNLATIVIDPAKHEDEQGVLESLLHELLHVALGRLDLYYEATGKGSVVERRIWAHALEQTVWRLERAFAHLIEKEAA